MNFNISGIPLTWIESYLTNRKARVAINESHSSEIYFDVGVPQGLVMFNCLMSRLSGIIQSQGANCYVYADVTQFWLSFNPSEPSAGVDARVLIHNIFGLVSAFNGV